jgi:hypothetical protein
MTPVLEWQFFIEELDLILVQDGQRYRSIDDPGILFQVVAPENSARQYEYARVGISCNSSETKRPHREGTGAVPRGWSV